MNNIITISREFGSGGKEIGKRLADELGYAYYDTELITMLAHETGKSKEYLNNISEKGIYPYAFNFGKSFSMYSNMQKEQTGILIKQTKIIQEIASRGNCIIVGRAADVILDNLNVFKIFVYASMESKIKRCETREDNNLSTKEIKKKIQEIDKNRKGYHMLLSGKEWGQKENYDLCLNTTDVEIKTIIKPLAEYILVWFSKEEK